MKITFVLPDMSWLWDYKSQFPLGILYLSTQIKGAGGDVGLYDTNCNSVDDIPFSDVFAFSVVHATYANSIELAKRIKAKYPNSKIIVGGCHITSTAPNIDPVFDSYFVGQAELTILQFMRDLRHGSFYRQYTQDTLFKTLDDFTPDRTLLPDDYLRTKSIFTGGKTYSEGGSTGIMFSRGCPYNCNFCASPVFYGNRILFRSIASIEAEVRDIINRYGIIQFRVQDDTLTANKAWFKQLHDALKPLDIYFRCSTRANTLDRETVEMLYDFGCREIGIGIEVADNEGLKLLNKRMTIEEIEQALNVIKQFPMVLRGFFMIGLPFDSPITIQKNIDFIERMQLDNVMTGMFYPFPGCEMAMHPDRYNIASIKPTSCLSIAKHIPLVPNILRTDITEEQHIAIMKPYYDFLIRKGVI